MLGTVPFDVVLTWPIPNYVDPVTRGWAVVIISVIFGSLALITSVARFWTKIAVAKKCNLCDYLMAVAILAMIGMLICQCMGTRVYQMDRHIWDVEVVNTAPGYKITFVMELFYVISTGLIKIAILSFYLRLTTRAVSPKFIYTVWVAIAIAVAYVITFVMSDIFMCVPFEAMWQAAFPAWAETHDYHCVDSSILVGVVFVINMVHDCVVFLLPVSLLYGMRIPLKQKIAISVTFGMGLLVCVLSAGRVAYLLGIVGDSWDETWNVYTLWCMTGVEVPLMVVCANAPALRLFFKTYLGSISTATTDSDSSDTFAVVSEYPASFTPGDRSLRSSDWSGLTMGSNLTKVYSNKEGRGMTLKELEITQPLAVYGRMKTKRVRTLYDVEAALEEDPELL